MARIELDRVNLTFQVRATARRGTLKEFVIGLLRRRPVAPLMTVKALQDVSLSLKPGDRLGVIGHNCAGKSTLLKLLAGVYPPTSRRCIVEGQISSLFEISLGFEQEATGWENINYRGYLQGETPRSIRAKAEGIAAYRCSPDPDALVADVSAAVRAGVLRLDGGSAATPTGPAG